jgi:hypothetical protein
LRGEDVRRHVAALTFFVRSHSVSP